MNMTNDLLKTVLNVQSVADGTALRIQEDPGSVYSDNDRASAVNALVVCGIQGNRLVGLKDATDVLRDFENEMSNKHGCQAIMTIGGLRLDATNEF